ncbi:MYPU_1760 family metalloprotease [Mycoplasma hafezii]|uniref:MYPU_1760 family metalloprotease n=1 Tax=Mycoplasma hafezii TaxID=525886 RepID=UPI003CE7DF9D
MKNKIYRLIVSMQLIPTSAMAFVSCNETKYNPKTSKIVENEEFFTDFQKWPSYFDNSKSLSEVLKISEKDFNVKYFEDRVPYIEYIDPETKIHFRDYSYKNENNKFYFYLGKYGLVILANEFKNKIPYLNEVFDLNSINLNINSDLIIKNGKVNGYYQAETKTINLFTSKLFNLALTPMQIISYIMPTLFHEYIHHFASSYISNPDLLNKDNSVNYLGRYQNKEFAEAFIDLFQYKNKKIESTGSKNINNYLSLSDLFSFANNNRQIKYDNEQLKKLYFNKMIKSSINRDKLKYIYSFDELIAREYTKYGFENYYSDLVEAQGNKLQSDFFGIFDGKNYLYYSYLYDWSRSLKMDKLNKEELLNKNISYFGSLKNEYPYDIFWNQQKAYDVYNLFTKASGYGKNINQIHAKMNWKYIIENGYKSSSKFWLDDKDINQVMFTGFLENKPEQNLGIAIFDKNANQIMSSSLLDVQNNDNFWFTDHFFGKKSFDRGADIYNFDARQKQLDSRILNDKYYSYTTKDFLDLTNLQSNYRYSIYFFIDKNNNQIAENNELLFKKQLTLPNRTLTSLKSSVLTNNLDKTFVVFQDEKQTYIEKIKE